MNQENLFDQTNEAVARAESNANSVFIAEAEKALNVLIAAGAEFSTDDIWALIPDGVETHDNRAMGGVVRRASSCGRIVSTGGYVKSVRSECHSRPVAVWKPSINML